MRLGFTSLYSWRPHTEQMYYLSLLAQKAGHEVRFLACDSDLSTCYIRQMRAHRPQMVECGICRLGNIKTFCGEGVSSIGELSGEDFSVPSNASAGIGTSASTLGRFETDADYNGTEFLAFVNALRPAAQKTYAAARTWIARERLDGVYLFNGRMDITRSVLEAARDAGIPFVSMERTWFGDGIQLLPNESSTGLKNIDQIVADWRDRPLTRRQALMAASHIASRFLRRNQNEWRAYNVRAKKTPWPIEESRHRLLLLPGSRNEIWGHEGWESGWSEPVAAFDALIEHLKLAPQDIVLRCHPNWGENIGRVKGEKSEKYYTDWAKKRGVFCIPSHDTTSTMGLIEECDAVTVASGSAALEAGALGKQVIALGPSWYQKAGFQTTVYSRSDLGPHCLNKDRAQVEQSIIARNIQKRTLRFCYTVGYRLAQFVPFVRAKTTTEYDYFEGADPARVTRLLETGKLEPDDDVFAPDDGEENEVLDIVGARMWDRLQMPSSQNVLKRLQIHRRHVYQAVDLVRSKMRRGDL